MLRSTDFVAIAGRVRLFALAKPVACSVLPHQSSFVTTNEFHVRGTWGFVSDDLVALQSALLDRKMLAGLQCAILSWLDVSASQRPAGAMQPALQADAYLSQGNPRILKFGCRFGRGSAPTSGTSLERFGHIRTTVGTSWKQETEKLDNLRLLKLASSRTSNTAPQVRTHRGTHGRDTHGQPPRYVEGSSAIPVFAADSNADKEGGTRSLS